jgi:hypothetical protein
VTKNEQTTLVVAGSINDYRRWCRAHGLHETNDDFFYALGIDRARGVPWRRVLFLEGCERNPSLDLWKDYARYCVAVYHTEVEGLLL